MDQIKATKDHCKYCFQILNSILENQDLPPLPASIPDVSVPLFVTWNYRGDLRGCIGTF